MFREIKKKKLILENRKPYPIEKDRFLDEMNQVDWIYSSLRLDGFNVNKESVERILKGDFLVNMSVSIHATISNFQQMIKLLHEMAGMDVYLNENYVFKVYETLERPPETAYRKSNPILRMINYNPPHFKEIEEQMEMLFHWLHSDQYQTNPIEKAAYLHNKLIEIYPFETGTESIARSLAQYYLMQNGFPPILWNLSEQEYYDAVEVYLKKEEIQPIYDVLERGVYNKLEIMMQLTAE